MTSAPSQRSAVTIELLSIWTGGLQDADGLDPSTAVRAVHVHTCGV
jgi:hypothetical protein